MTYNLSYFDTSASPEKIYNIVKSIIFILVMKVFFLNSEALPKCKGYIYWLIICSHLTESLL